MNLPSNQKNSQKSELRSPEFQVGVATLKALQPLATEFNYLRKTGFEIVIPPELETAYVSEYGEEGQRFIDILLGRKEAMASVNFKIRMRLEE